MTGRSFKELAFIWFESSPRTKRFHWCTYSRVATTTSPMVCLYCPGVNHVFGIPIDVTFKSVDELITPNEGRSAVCFCAADFLSVYCKTNCFRKEVGHLISLGHGRSHRILSFISETYTGISQNNKHHDSARHEKSISVLWSLNQADISDKTPGAVLISPVISHDISWLSNYLDQQPVDNTNWIHW